MKSYTARQRPRQSHRAAGAFVAFLTLLNTTRSAQFASPAEERAYLSRALADQAEQIREGEQRAQRLYHQRDLEMFRHTGNLAFLVAFAQTASADEAGTQLSPLLGHTNADVRLVALDGLACHRSALLNSLPGVIGRLDDADERIADRSAQVLGSLGPAAVTAVPALERVLAGTTHSAGLCEASATALGCVGPAARHALPTLDRTAHNPAAGVALAAMLAAGKIRAEPPLTCAELRRTGPAVFASANAYRAFQAARVPVCPTQETASLLVRFAPHAPPALRIEVCNVFGGLQVATPELLQVLLNYLADQEPRVQASAAAAMAQLPATNLTFIPLLAEAASGPDDFCAENSARLLARFGAAAGPAAPQMIQIVQRFHGSAHFRRTQACLAAIRVAGTNAAPVRDALVGMLPETAVIYSGLTSHEAKLVRASLLLALTEVGTTDAALPAVVDELANATPSALLAAAARAAGAFPDQPARLVPLLRDVLARPELDAALDLDQLNDPFTHVVISPTNATSIYLESIRSLHRFGASARPALAVLRQRARDPARPAPFFPPYQQEAAEVASRLAKMP
jgi:hypothetical protein